jgi:hypothetical protein
MAKVKIFRCDCGWAFHSLRLETDTDEQFPSVCVSVVNSPADLNIIQRIKGAWNILLGKEHVMSEVWIHRDEVKEFVEFLSCFVLNPSTASGVPTLRAVDMASPSENGEVLQK